MSLDFLVTSLLIVLAPGTGALYTITIGSTLDRKSSIVASFGCTLGIIPHIIAAVSGLSAILHASAVAFDAIRYLGAVYLVYLGIMLIRNRDSFEISGSNPHRKYGSIIKKAILINLLNPKLSIFFFSFLPQFVSGNPAQNTLEMIFLASIFMLLTFLVFCVYGILANLIKNQLITNPSLVNGMRYVFGATFIGLGLSVGLRRE